ncbi:MAG: AAA family ATPase [Anaerolineae bacterium]
MTRIYAFANQKGGVGKTTTAINLGAYLAARGKKLLLVDIDPQANATSSLGVDKNHLPFSIYEALIQEMPLSQIVMPIDKAGLELVPSSPSLAGATVELVRVPERTHLLHKALATLDKQYDYVFVDAPPSLGILTVNALTATHGVVIPVQCEYLSLEGLGQLVHTINLVRRELNPGLRITGLIMTMYDVRTKIAQQVVKEVHKYFPEKVFSTIIPRNVRLSEAPSYGETILTYAPKSSGALAYEALAKEFLRRTDQTGGR